MRSRQIIVALFGLLPLLGWESVFAQQADSSSKAQSAPASKATPSKGRSLSELLGGPLKEGVPGEVQALRREYLQAMLQWHRKSRDEQIAAGKALTSSAFSNPPAVVAEFAPRFFKAAEKYAGTDDALPFLEWCLFTDPTPGNKTTRAALDVLLEKNLDCAGLAETLTRFSRLQGKLGGDYEKILKRIIKETHHDEVRAAAHFARAEGAIKSAGSDKSEDGEAKGVREAAVADYQTALRLAPEGPFAPVAQGALYKMKNLQVGMKAPEIVGKDLQGQPIKLSDFSGKVVMISFWATWCGPCMAMIPHERELVQKFADAPFVLVGVNGDQDPQEAHAIAKKNGVTWRSFWDGPKVGAGKISTLWNVRGWPTIILIDHKGIIRAQGHWVDDKLLKKLVDEAQKQ